MHILVAPDSFKDTLSSNLVAAAISQGIKNVMPAAKISCAPMADGGEGTLDILSSNDAYYKVHTTTQNALGNTIEAFYLSNVKQAIVELACTSGLQQLKPKDRNVLSASTFGTGIQIRHAVENGCNSIVVTLGGSATNDGGTGILNALGVQFLDKTDKVLLPNGGNLNDIAKIDTSELIEINNVKFTLACDVRCPVFGPNGSAQTYAQQKGAKPHEVPMLDEGLHHLYNLFEINFGKKINYKELGAAGAAGMGLAFIADIELANGFDLLKSHYKLDTLIDTVDLVITGEGKLDMQTKQGKLVDRLVSFCAERKKDTIIIAGSVDMESNFGWLYKQRVKSILSIVNEPASLEELKPKTYKLIKSATEQVMRLISK